MPIRFHPFVTILRLLNCLYTPLWLSFPATTVRARGGEASPWSHRQSWSRRQRSTGGVFFVLDKSSEFRERLEHQLTAWGLPKSLVDDLANHLTPVTYEKDAIIFLRGSA